MNLDFTKVLVDNNLDAIKSKRLMSISLIDEMEITVFIDSDPAHDKVLRESIMGILILVARTPVVYSNKRQGVIETSTYDGMELCVMKNAVNELIALRYMLRCL